MQNLEEKKRYGPFRQHKHKQRKKKRLADEHK